MSSRGVPRRLVPVKSEKWTNPATVLFQPLVEHLVAFLPKGFGLLKLERALVFHLVGDEGKFECAKVIRPNKVGFLRHLDEPALYLTAKDGLVVVASGDRSYFVVAVDWIRLGWLIDRENGWGS